MSLKPPQLLGLSQSGTLDPLAYELMAEKADALGRSGLKVEKALAALAACPGDDGQRELRLDEAAEAVWRFFIQREICGLRNQADAVRRYGVPKEVMARLGVVRR